MTKIPFEDAAKRDEPMPEGLLPIEVYTWQAISYLAGRYRLKRISAEAAQVEMEKIRRAYQKGLADLKYSEYLARFRNSTCWALMKYGTDRTLENADIMWQAVSGLTVYDPKQEAKKAEKAEEEAGSGEVLLAGSS